MMKNSTIEAGALRVDERILVPSIDVPRRTNGIQVFKSTDADLQSGVTEVLREFAVAKRIGGDHMFWRHKSPPLPHHPSAGKHEIFWIDNLGDGSEIDPWHDDSWVDLLADRTFLQNADVMFAEMQARAEAENRNLRIYYLFGFAKESDKARAYDPGILPRGSQSQYRGHIHVVEAIDNSDERVNWLDKSDLLSGKSLLPLFLNTPGELAINHYSGELRDFGEKVTYNQTIDNSEVVSAFSDNDKVSSNGLIYNVERTMFSFYSWEEALDSVLDLYNKLLSGWLKTAAEIAKNRIEFAGAQLEFLQSCLPGFTFIKPSTQDKAAGGIEQKVNWLVVPFSTPVPQAILQPGVLLNRLPPNKKNQE